MNFINKAISTLIFTTFFSTFLLSQIQFDTLTYQVGGTKVRYNNLSNYILNDDSNLDYVTIHGAKGSDNYFWKTKEFKKFDFGIRMISILSLHPRVFKKRLEGFFQSNKNGKLGIIDTDGKEVIPPIFDEFRTGDVIDHFIAYKRDSIFLINLKGDIVFIGKEFKKFSTHLQAPNRIKTETETENIILDFQGKELIRSSEYDLSAAGSSDYVFARIRDDYSGAYFLLDFKGNIVIQPKRKYDAFFSDDNFLIFTDLTSYSEVYDYNLKPIEYPNYNIISLANSPNLYQIKRGIKTGLINEKLEVVLPPVKNSFFSYSRDNLIKIENHLGSNLYKSNGDRISPKGYVELNSVWGTDLFVVKGRRGGWGVVNQNNDTIIPLEYKDIRGYMRPVEYSKNKKTSFFAFKKSATVSHFYNDKGELISQGAYTRFVHGKGSDGNRLFLIKGKNTIVLVDNDGRQVSSITYRSISPRLDSNPSDYLVVQNAEEKFGLIDKNGREILPMTYLKILNIDDSIFVFKDNQGAGFFRLKK